MSDEVAVVIWHGDLPEEKPAQLNGNGHTRGDAGPEVATQPRDSRKILRDYNIEYSRFALLCAVSVLLGIVGAIAAYCLLSLIALLTNAIFFSRASATLPSIDGHDLGAWIILVPIAGSVVVGLIARFGADKIRGHGA